MNRIGTRQLVSARDLFESQYPGQCAWWKYYAMKAILFDKFRLGIKVESDFSLTNCSVISIGDSWAEFIASSWLQTTMSREYSMEHMSLHRVRLRKDPSIDEMLEQFDFLIKTAGILSADERQSMTIHYAINREIEAVFKDSRSEIDR